MTGLDFADDPRRGCAPGKVDPEIFFADRGGQQDKARAVCRGCPFTGECLDRALEQGERFGVWAGVLMSATAERRKAVERVTQAQIRELWQRGLSDSAIGLRIGRSPGDVQKIRKRLELPALYGPGGRRTRAAVAA